MKVDRAHTCALIYFCQNFDVFFESVLKSRLRETGLTLHSQCQTRRHPRGFRQELLFLLDRGHEDHGVVEPDGIEPTTSCLQSTRSTN